MCVFRCLRMTIIIFVTCMPRMYQGCHVCVTCSWCAARGSARDLVQQRPAARAVGQVSVKGRGRRCPDPPGDALGVGGRWGVEGGRQK